MPTNYSFEHATTADDHSIGSTTASVKSNNNDKSSEMHEKRRWSGSEASIASKFSIFDPTAQLHPHGVNWILASILVVGEMAGGGLVSLPHAFVDAGPIGGCILTIVSAVLSGYTGVQLGDNWIMMQERWHEYRESCRKPYPEMAYRSMGRAGRIFLLFVIGIQQFGLGIVFLILASKNIATILVTTAGFHMNLCYIILIVAALATPLLMIGTIKDFWQAGVIAMVSTTAAIVIIFIGAAHDEPICRENYYLKEVEVEKFFLSYGTIMFAYGGHSLFPTIQHEMKKPHMFRWSVILGYSAIVVMYLPISIFGFYVYGESVSDTIIANLQLAWTQDVANGLITIHAFFTLILVLSPLSLAMEDLLHVQDKFGPKRIIVRLIILLALIIVATSLPQFGLILDIIGGTTITLMTMILPSLFYLCLVAGKRKREEMIRSGQFTPKDVDNIFAYPLDIIKYNRWWVLIINVAVLAFGLIGGVASTYAAVKSLIATDIDTPCYVKLFQNIQDASSGAVYCCGEFKNITTISGKNPADFCAL